MNKADKRHDFALAEVRNAFAQDIAYDLADNKTTMDCHFFSRYGLISPKYVERYGAISRSIPRWADGVKEAPVMGDARESRDRSRENAHIIVPGKLIEVECLITRLQINGSDGQGTVASKLWRNGIPGVAAMQLACLESELLMAVASGICGTNRALRGLLKGGHDPLHGNEQRASEKFREISGTLPNPLLHLGELKFDDEKVGDEAMEPNRTPRNCRIMNFLECTRKRLLLGQKRLVNSAVACIPDATTRTSDLRRNYLLFLFLSKKWADKLRHSCTWKEYQQTKNENAARNESLPGNCIGQYEEIAIIEEEYIPSFVKDEKKYRRGLIIGREAIDLELNFEIICTNSEGKKINSSSQSLKHQPCFISTKAHFKILKRASEEPNMSGNDPQLVDKGIAVFDMEE